MPTLAHLDAAVLYTTISVAVNYHCLLLYITIDQPNVGCKLVQHSNSVAFSRPNTAQSAWKHRRVGTENLSALDVAGVYRHHHTGQTYGLNISWCQGSSST